MMSAIRLLWRNKLVRNHSEKTASPAILNLLLLRICPISSRLITCRAITATHHDDNRRVAGSELK